MSTTRADIGAGASLRDSVRAAAIGDAGIQLAVIDYRLEGARSPEPFERTYQFEGEQVEVRIIPGNSFIDLNAAEHGMLTALFVHAAGVGQAEAELLAERVVAWRTPSDLQELPGSERANYGAAGAAFVPRHGSFESVADLMQVLGVDLDTYVKIEPFISVHEAGQGVWPQTAPEGVLMVIAAGNREIVDAFLEGRRTEPATADVTRFEQSFLGVEGRLVLHASATVRRGSHLFQRTRWIDANRLGAMGEPWATVQIEPVRVMRHDSPGY